MLILLFQLNDSNTSTIANLHEFHESTKNDLIKPIWFFSFNQYIVFFVAKPNQ